MNLLISLCISSEFPHDLLTNAIHLAFFMVEGPSCLLSSIAKLLCSIVGLVSFSSSSKMLEYTSPVIVGTSEVRIKSKGLLKGSKGQFVALTVLEHASLVIVDISIARIKSKSLFIGSKGLLVTFKGKKYTSFASVGKGTIGIKPKSLLIGSKSLFVALEFIKCEALVLKSSCTIGVKLNSPLKRCKGILYMWTGAVRTTRGCVVIFTRESEARSQLLDEQNFLLAPVGEADSSRYKKRTVE